MSHTGCRANGTYADHKCSDHNKFDTIETQRTLTTSVNNLADVYDPRDVKLCSSVTLRVGTSFYIIC